MSSWQQHSCYRNVTYKTWAGVFLERGAVGGAGGALPGEVKGGAAALTSPPPRTTWSLVLTDIHEKKLFFMLLKAAVNINGGQMIARARRAEEGRLVFDAGTPVRGESGCCRMFRYWPLVVSVGNNTRRGHNCRCGYI